jgi:GGDEF domain-containing protein
MSVAMFVYTDSRHRAESRLQRVRRQVFARIAHFELHASMSSQYFLRRLQQECHRSRRYQLPLTLVVMQSRMEDREGQPDLERHLKNSVLTMVAVEMRREDVVGQLGELEYGFYLPHTGQAGGLLVLKRVMASFAGYSPRVGMAEYGEDGNDASSLVEAAREDAEHRWSRDNASEAGAKLHAA